MKFGLWTEIEDIGPESQLFREHSDWCLSYNGHPIRNSGRCQLNFARPEVRKMGMCYYRPAGWRKYHLEWIKIDYNIAVGYRFDPPGMGVADRGCSRSAHLALLQVPRSNTGCLSQLDHRELREWRFAFRYRYLGPRAHKLAFG